MTSCNLMFTIEFLQYTLSICVRDGMFGFSCYVHYYTNVKFISGVTFENQTYHGVDHSAVLQHEFGLRNSQCWYHSTKIHVIMYMWIIMFSSPSQSKDRSIRVGLALLSRRVLGTVAY